MEDSWLSGFDVEDAERSAHAGTVIIFGQANGSGGDSLVSFPADERLAGPSVWPARQRPRAQAWRGPTVWYAGIV